MSAVGRPLWKRVLRRPFLATRRAAEAAASLAVGSAPFQSLQTARLGGGPAPKARAALVAHVFYPELWPEVDAAWRTLPAGSPAIVTGPPAALENLARSAGEREGLILRPTENRGRDVAPFMTLLNDGALDPFDAVLKLHTKRSMHLLDGDLRRRLLFNALAGNSANVARALRWFETSDVALVGLAPAFRRHPRYWFDDRPRVEALCAAMRPSPPVRLGFFEGTMFWVRPSALAPLRRLGLTTQDFEAEAGQTDGTLHHALERAFTLAALAQGGRTLSLRGRTLLAP
jgi:rhamnosyltransferase